MKQFYLFIIFFLSTGVFFSQSSYNTLVYKGNRAFNKGDFGSAATHFSEAEKFNSKDFTAHYNLGNSLYKQKKYAEAQSEFQKAGSIAKTRADKAAAFHNLGNSYMMSNAHEKAAEAFKNSLKQDPYSQATQKNYQIAMLKEKEQQQKNQQKQNSGGGGNGNKKDKSEKGNGDKNKQPLNGNGGKGQSGENGEGQNQDNKSGNQGSNMPKNVENALLNRAGNKERETAKRILNKESYSTPQSNAKDW